MWPNHVNGQSDQGINYQIENNLAFEDILQRIDTEMRKRGVAPVSKNLDTRRVDHYIGTHPHFAEKDDLSVSLPLPAVLIAEEWSEGIYLFRLTAEGHYAGDTWHQSIEEAKDQANYEYGEAVGPWRAVPEAVQGLEAIVGFALGQGNTTAD